MTAYTAEMLADLPCDRCGYDLRAHSLDAKCPECGASVAESRRLGAIPRRPAWRDSDPRWRRRMLAGAWILVLLPLMDALQMSGWAARLRVPAIFEFGSFVRTLDESFLSIWVFPRLLFCMGVVLLFSKERGRRPCRLDWTRRWGVLCSYVVMLLWAAGILLITALVALGISAVFLSMPLKFQPGMTQLLVDVSGACLRYGPCPKPISEGVLVAFSSIAILLACVPLYDALRSSGPKRLAALLLAPLAFFALMHLGQASLYCISFPRVTSSDISQYEVYFFPRSLAEQITGLPGSLTVAGWVAFLVEAAKWCIVLVIAIWLSIAQFAAWRQRRRPTARADALGARINDEGARDCPRLAALLAVRDRAFSRVETKSAHAPQAVRLNGHQNTKSLIISSVDPALTPRWIK